jgi:hypothetical protein
VWTLVVHLVGYDPKVMHVFKFPLDFSNLHILDHGDLFDRSPLVSEQV